MLALSWTCYPPSSSCTSVYHVHPYHVFLTSSPPCLVYYFTYFPGLVTLFLDKERDNLCWCPPGAAELVPDHRYSMNVHGIVEVRRKWVVWLFGTLPCGRKDVSCCKCGGVIVSGVVHTSHLRYACCVHGEISISVLAAGRWRWNVASARPVQLASNACKLLICRALDPLRRIHASEPLGGEVKSTPRYLFVRSLGRYRLNFCLLTTRAFPCVWCVCVCVLNFICSGHPGEWQPSSLHVHTLS